MSGFDPKSLASDLKNRWTEISKIDAQVARITDAEIERRLQATLKRHRERKRRPQILVSEMCDHPYKSGGRHHKGHDRCIRLRKRLEAQARQLAFAEETSKRRRLAVAATEATGRQRGEVVPEVSREASLQRKREALDALRVPNGRVAGSAPLAMSRERRRTR
jgi:hypothetical protein